MKDPIENVVQTLYSVLYCPNIETIVKEHGCKSGHFTVCNGELMYFDEIKDTRNLLHRIDDVVVGKTHIYTTILYDSVWYFGYDYVYHKAMIGINIKTGAIEYVAVSQSRNDSFRDLLVLIKTKETE